MISLNQNVRLRKEGIHLQSTRSWLVLDAFHSAYLRQPQKLEWRLGPLPNRQAGLVKG